MSVARLALAPLFGLAMMGALTLSWLLLERSFTTKFSKAVLMLGASATLSAAMALACCWLLRRSVYSARLAASMVVLLVGTSGIVCLMGTFVVLASHFGEEHSPQIWMLLSAFAGAGAAYNFLSAAGWTLLPFGAPLAFLIAALIAKERHRSGVLAPGAQRDGERVNDTSL